MPYAAGDISACVHRVGDKCRWVHADLPTAVDEKQKLERRSKVLNLEKCEQCGEY